MSIPSASSPPSQERLRHAVERGLAHLVARQQPDGAWRGDYGGPLFLLPMYVAACHIAGHDIPPDRRTGMVHHFESVQAPDGSLGLHPEAPGAMFTTALGYVALRLLGADPGAPLLERMRHWIRANGTPLAAASWGKFVLALLNLYDYDGLNPLLPELWLLPTSAPVHPGRLWCHCRQVYLPMAYLYGRRARAPETELIRQLRAELYARPYAEIRFRDHRDTLAPSDSLLPVSSLLGWANRAMGCYEGRHSARLRARAEALLLEHIDFEDRATSFIRLGPVNAVLNTIVHHFRDDRPRRDLVDRSFACLDGYLSQDARAVAMNGYNSTALWDTAFAAQTILATPLAAQHASALGRAYDYLRDNQILEDLPSYQRFHRHSSRGGWPFSDRRHGWPISDCTAEGLLSALRLEPWIREPMAAARLEDAARLLLSLQNDDGGWATYERQRGPTWLERLNPSQVFGKIMVDYSYVECTSACLAGLTAARERFTGALCGAVDQAILRGEAFLRAAQRNDGGFEGSWAVCFTYGTWFGVRGLRAAGATSSDAAIRNACSFLLSHQRSDGGWGESYRSCIERRYVQHSEGHAVNTAWALLALGLGAQAEHPRALNGVQFLLDRQQADGSWPRQSLVGVFNRTALIDYDNYRRYFPIWALAGYL
jgi:squalene/oxidosqualene cyclase-like protein